MPEFNQRQFLPLYFTSRSAKVLANLRILAALARRLGQLDTKLETLWVYADLVEATLAADETGLDSSALEPYQRQVVWLLDSDKLREFVVRFEQIESYLIATKAGAKNENTTIVKSGAVSDDSVVVELNWLVLSEETQTRWIRYMSGLSDTEQKIFIGSLVKLKEILGPLFIELRYVATALGATPFLVPTYTWDEFKENIGNWDKLNVARLARTVVEFMHNEYKKDAARELLNICLRPAVDDETNYSWEEAYLMIIFTHAIFHALPYLSVADRERCLANYFYRAVMMGVPVREILQAIVYDTETPIDYALETGRLLEAVANNVEMVVLDVQARRLEAWGDIVKKYLDEVGDAAADEKRQTQFVDRLVGNVDSSGAAVSKDVEYLRVWLNEVLSIFVHLKNGDLIDHNRGGELTDDEAAYNDMIQLLAWFGVGEGGVGDIVKYFSQPEPRVSLPAFLSRLKEATNLSQDVTLENVMIISSALQEAELLTADDELVVFHESDGQFHWNQARNF